jgi:hypothetical protein
VLGAPLANNLAEQVLKLCMRQRHYALFSKHEHSASLASVLTSLRAPCLYAGGKAVESLVARPEHRGEVCAAPAAWRPGAYARRRASPEAPRRQSCAIGSARGGPFHRTMMRTRGRARVRLGSGAPQ